MALEDEEEAFEPVQLENLDPPAVVAETWPVVGRFLTEKMVKLEYMRQVLASVWKPVKGVQITELHPNLFMFVFFHASDMEYVLDEGPWSFDNCTLVCRQVKDGVLPVEVPLDSVDMWIQLHDVPIGYTSSIILEQIGNHLGRFVKGDDRFSDAPWLDFYRIRVALPVNKPIKRRMKLLKRDGTWCWITFKYERLHSFCFFCGMMGHTYKFCLKAREAAILVNQFPFGPELRAGQRRGPRAVGNSWLVPVGGSPRAESVVEASAGVRNNAVLAVVATGRREGETGVVAVSKRRREGSGGGARCQGSDVVMSDVPKNLHVAGSGHQTRPSS
ncbi:uncharacterized protein LOC116023439 [Ipomoea triloba]|uniref:uncharacterized protein LOC116023439 n=1 Tax=Ipomoea triloba TaxID=35885 RepID=UPI00125E9B60|nr:uncharacterized protein LOC116023439 [Ipomoea triloba]